MPAKKTPASKKTSVKKKKSTRLSSPATALPLRKKGLPQPPLGAHMSIAGGVDRAIDRARDAGCTALQIFLKNNNQWRGKKLSEREIERFRSEIAKGDLGCPIAHGSYLVNLASPDAQLVAKGMENLLDDLRRAETLGVAGIVLHPGSHMGRGEKKAIQQIARNDECVVYGNASRPVQALAQAGTVHVLHDVEHQEVGLARIQQFGDARMFDAG